MTKQLLEPVCTIKWCICLLYEKHSVSSCIATLKNMNSKTLTHEVPFVGFNSILTLTISPQSRERSTGKMNAALRRA